MMDIDIQRRIDRVFGQPLCWLLSLMDRWCLRKPERPKDVKNILVILLSEMGSLVLAGPMFKRIAMDYPQASVYALVFGKNREVLELNDFVKIENIYTIDGGRIFQMGFQSLRVMRDLRKIGIDVVLDCELFSRVSSIYSYLSGALIRVGFHPHTQEGLYRGDFINRAVLYNPYVHISRQFVTLVEAINSCESPSVKVQTGDDRLSPDIVQISEHRIIEMRKRLEADFPLVCQRPLILLYPSGGLLPIRAWPIERYGDLACSLINDGYSIGVIGLPEDKELADRIIAACNNRYCIDLTGYTRSIKELLSLFHHAKLLITNDGGPGHFASMIGLPALILYGPETPLLYGSLSPVASNIYSPLTCSPCLTAYNHRKSPCDGNNICLKQISMESVISSARNILRGNNH